ncbi:MAG: DUF3035 domain-containing protein [Emcibacteraceae bacterium]|nr:DUF3035 domain-containing protein [Emcibacteraceae bacterium]MDG1995438.1 DUF3035 domain-containing protein [Emcibacteraceae bacterium]
MKNKLTLMVSVFALAAVLTGCSGKNVPDEFLVLKNAPLAMPPGFHMTPDGPTSDIDDALEPQEIAKRALFGEAS